MPMGENISTDMTVLFADVAGSVELYAALGDVQAHQRIVHYLKSMSTCIERYQGRVVETIGDEIMCAFTDPDYALAAACEIQESLQRDRKWALDVRVGLHSGVTSMTNGHPFGDTVNVAARVVELAKAGQIMLTDQAYRSLSEAGKSRTRFFRDVYIKGKRTPYTIHQALWDLDDYTLTVECNIAKPVERRHPVYRFSLRYRDAETTLEEGSELLLGRGEQCGLRINSETASRIHAILKCRTGRLILTDRSTNGTFIKTMAGKRSLDNLELFFHHDEWTTTCSGVLSLGQPVSNQNPDLVHFSFF
ncbi:MAG: adenylate/guanylate cyclase domain-containing protein [Pseudomonadota bacterium]|nr:adenylate/guanylate cyclase domain-containing protein [Pseudomonadota bacterium]